MLDRPDLSLLHGECDGQTVSRVVEEIATSNASLDIVAMMTIVKRVLPFFPSLNPNSRNHLTKMVSHSFPFLCQIVSFVRAMPGDQQEARIYKEVLLEVLQNENWLLNYIKQCKTKLERGNLKSVIFGSKLFNVLAPDINMLAYLELLKTQWSVVFDRPFLVSSGYSDLLTSMLVLHSTLSPDVIFGQLVLTDDHHFECFKLIVSGAKLFDQRRLINFLLSYLQMHTNLKNYHNALAVLEKLPLHKSVDLEMILHLNSLILQELLLRLPPHENPGLVLELTRKFADAQEEDEKICQLLVIMLKHKMNSVEKGDLSRDPSFLDAVTKRLSSEDAALRERTMYVAKLVSDGELKYESDFVIVIPDLNLAPAHKIDYDALKEGEAAVVRQPLSLSHDVVRLTLSDDAEPVVFLKDLIKKYESNDKKQRVPLLQLTVKLLRQKKNFPLEVGYYSTTLLPQLATLNNAQEESQFEHWRINALVSLIVVTPEAVRTLQRILFTSELSLQQRMSLLSGLGLAARELRGEDNGSLVVKPEYDFPTRRLPWDKPTQNAIEKKSEPGSALSQTVWRSKKLDKEAGPSNINTNRFKKHAQTFFYPLAQGWFRGIQLGTYDKLFKTHYLKTLTIIYDCSYPHAEYEQMTEAMLQVTKQALEQGITP
ncbi:related to Telomere length regulation protein TEL2 [Zygosaccharomyces bailii ISA1307]|nr:related to Telomere length regulation protein TEL2 [Zygosaccharomyces bailii ISA1307]